MAYVIRAAALLGSLALFVSAQTPCQTCEWGLRLIDDALCDPGVEDFLLTFFNDQVCPALGPNADECRTAVQALLPVAIEYVRQSASPEQLCSSVGVCSIPATKVNAAKARTQRWLQRVKSRDSIGCSMCEYVVTVVKSEVDDPVTLTKIKQAAEQACAALPDALAGPCLDLVDNYGDMLISMLDGLDPQLSCSLMGMCTTKLLAQADVQLPALPVTLLQPLGALRTAHTQLTSNMCDVCRLAVLEAHTLVSNPAVQAQLTNYTKALCAGLGTPAADTCRSYVDVYGPVVFTAIQQYLQPDAVCAAISMCGPAAGSGAGQDLGSLPAVTGAAAVRAASGMPKKVLPGRVLDLGLQHPQKQRHV